VALKPLKECNEALANMLRRAFYWYVSRRALTALQSQNYLLAGL